MDDKTRDELKRIAKDSESSGDFSTAVVLNVLIGASYGNMADDYARVSKDFARDAIKAIKAHLN